MKLISGTTTLQKSSGWHHTVRLVAGLHRRSQLSTTTIFYKTVPTCHIIKMSPRTAEMLAHLITPALGGQAVGPIYEKYAEIYDATGQDEFGKRMLKDLHELLKEAGLCPRTALDLACGTGTVAVLLAQEGIEVWGLDASERMLSVAKRKSEQLGLPITLTVGRASGPASDL